MDLLWLKKISLCTVIAEQDKREIWLNVRIVRNGFTWNVTIQCKKKTVKSRAIHGCAETVYKCMQLYDTVYVHFVNAGAWIDGVMSTLARPWDMIWLLMLLKCYLVSSLLHLSFRPPLVTIAYDTSVCRGEDISHEKTLIIITPFPNIHRIFVLDISVFTVIPEQDNIISDVSDRSLTSSPPMLLQNCINVNAIIEYFSVRCTEFKCTSVSCLILYSLCIYSVHV